MASYAVPVPTTVDDDDAHASLGVPRMPSRAQRFYSALVESQAQRAQREIDGVLGYGTLASAFDSSNLKTNLPER